jgi:hypothetical protein
MENQKDNPGRKTDDKNTSKSKQSHPSQTHKSHTQTPERDRSGQFISNEEANERSSHGKNPSLNRSTSDKRTSNSENDWNKK